jgi:hypothetical protein
MGSLLPWGTAMAGTWSMADWVLLADARTAKQLGVPFPPPNPIPFDKMVQATWRSFTYLQGLRRSKGHGGKMPLACAEHYAYARTVVTIGGLPAFPMIIAGSLGYQTAKALFDEVGLLQEFGQAVTQGDGVTTPASGAQLEAAIDGAEEGLRLRYELSYVVKR